MHVNHSYDVKRIEKHNSAADQIFFVFFLSYNMVIDCLVNLILQTKQ